MSVWKKGENCFLPKNEVESRMYMHSPHFSTLLQMYWRASRTVPKEIRKDIDKRNAYHVQPYSFLHSSQPTNEPLAKEGTNIVLHRLH